MNVPLFYRPKPVFGFDIGYGTIKIAQLSETAKGPLIEGYGFATFDPSAMKDGILVEPETIAKSAYTLLTQDMVGAINTSRVSVSLPVAQTFTRILELPNITDSDLDKAVKLEAEQYIPLSLDELYIDYEVTTPAADKQSDQNQEVLMVAAKKTIIDSYLLLFDILGLEVDLLEPSTSAIGRLVKNSQKTDKPVLLIDLGSRYCDLTVYDQTIRMTDTVEVGGEHITNALSSKLNVSKRQADAFKSKYGLNKNSRQHSALTALGPLLNKMTAEIQKVLRYYKDRNKGRAEISEIVMLGGGANLPGLISYLEKTTKLKVRLCDPWTGVDFGTLQKPHPLEATLYTTAMGSAFYSIEKEKMS